MSAFNSTPTVLLLPAFCATTPRWQQLKHICDNMPDTPRSQWEAMGVWNHKEAAKLRKAGAK